MKNDEKMRLGRILSKTVLVCGIGLAYAGFTSLTGWGIPCWIHAITGLHCPGCGISRMFLALLRLDLVAAARYNLFVLCLLPVGLMLFPYKARQYVKPAPRTWDLPKKLAISLFSCCVLDFLY